MLFYFIPEILHRLSSFHVEDLYSNCNDFFVAPFFCFKQGQNHSLDLHGLH